MELISHSFLNGVMNKCRISTWVSPIRDLPNTAPLCRCMSLRQNGHLHAAHACERTVEEESGVRLLCDTWIMHSHAWRSGQAGCISCSTWMNSAAEHAQATLSKGQFEPSQTGVEPLIGMLSRFHFSRALF